tara:strand:+ start:106 stop:1152 length:1047 start_codon:yes stop_codon:yes gene_type:complete
MSTNQSDNTIFICSSIIDIGEILYQINSKKLSNFKIIITTDFQCYKLLSSIYGKKQIIFLNSKLVKSPRNIFFWIKELMIILYFKFLFKKHNIKEVFFYAPMYDLLACFLVLNIFSGSKIILSKPVFNEGMKEYKATDQRSLLNYLYSKLYGFPVTAYDNYRTKIFGDYIPGLPQNIIKNFDLNELVSIDQIKSVQKKYWRQYNTHSIDKSIILLNQSNLDMKIIKNFESRLSEINNVIKPYHVFVKNRYANNMKEPDTIFDNFNYQNLDAKLPAEYYDFSKCNHIIGIYSSSLARISHHQKVSLLNLFDYFDDNDRKKWITYLKNLSDDILYPNSIVDLKKIISNEK